MLNDDLANMNADAHLNILRNQLTLRRNRGLNSRK